MFNPFPVVAAVAVAVAAAFAVAVAVTAAVVALNLTPKFFLLLVFLTSHFFRNKIGLGKA